MNSGFFLSILILRGQIGGFVGFVPLLGQVISLSFPEGA